MPSLAEQLVAGPRGLRLCLGAASFQNQAVSRAVFDLRIELDPGTIVRFGSGGRGVSGTFDLAGRIADLRSLLGAVTTLESHWVHLALEAAVDGARYWQEPDGDEILASRPELRDELGRIAEIIAAMPIAHWWSDPIAPEQFQVRMHGWSDAVHRNSAAMTLDRWRRAICAAEAAPATLRDDLPDFHFWTGWWSTPPLMLTMTCPEIEGTPSGLYLVEDGFGETDAFVHRAIGSGTVLVIDSAQVWAELCREFPLSVTALRQDEWCRTTGCSDTEWVIPDWSAVAAQYSGVHLTVGAYLAASGTAIPVAPGVHSVMAGWAPGNTFWLREITIEDHGERFVYSGDDDLWHRADGVAYV